MEGIALNINDPSNQHSVALNPLIQKTERQIHVHPIRDVYEVVSLNIKLGYHPVFMGSRRKNETNKFFLGHLVQMEKRKKGRFD